MNELKREFISLIHNHKIHEALNFAEKNQLVKEPAISKIVDVLNWFLRFSATYTIDDAIVELIEICKEAIKQNNFPRVIRVEKVLKLLASPESILDSIEI